LSYASFLKKWPYDLAAQKEEWLFDVFPYRHLTIFPLPETKEQLIKNQKTTVTEL